MATNFLGGPEKQICHHCASMDRRDWRMVVCSFLEGKRENALLKRAEGMGLETGELRTSYPFNPWVIAEFVGLVKSKKADLIVAHGYRAFIISMLTRPFHGRQVIAYSRGYTEENGKVKFFESLHRRLLSRSDLVLAVSEGHKQALVRGKVPGEKIKVVYNAISSDDTGKGRSTDGKRLCEKLKASGATVVVTAGRLSPEKGHRYLIEAISSLGNRIPHTYFLFCGDGPLAKELKRQADQLGVTSRCFFLGFRHDLSEIFGQMDFMVLPSLSEGLPNVVLEAFAQSKAVVATAVGGVPEIVEDGVNGFLVPAGRPDALANAIEKLLYSAEMRSRLGEAGQRKVKREFSIVQQRQSLERVYRDMLEVHGER